jgi:hypothetical protein
MIKKKFKTPRSYLYFVRFNGYILNSKFHGIYIWLGIHMMFKDKTDIRNYLMVELIPISQ